MSFSSLFWRVLPVVLVLGVSPASPQGKAKVNREIVSVYQLYQASHKLGEIDAGVLMDILTADVAGKMAHETADLFNRSFDPPMDAKVVMPTPTLGALPVGKWFKPDLALAPVGVRGTKKGEERKGFDVASWGRDAGFLLGRLKVLTHDSSKKWGQEFLMQHVMTGLRGAGGYIKNMAGSHPDMADQKALGQLLFDTSTSLMEKSDYKKHRTAEFRGMVDDADAKMRTALKNFPAAGK